MVDSSDWSARMPRGRVEEVVEEPVVPGDALGRGALRRAPQRLERREGPGRGVRPRNVPPLDADHVRRQREADRGHARDRPSPERDRA